MKFRVFALLALAAAPLPAAPPKRELANIAFPPAPYPEEARRQGIEGNVVLTGDISADGRIGGLEVLASSSPLLEKAAVDHVNRTKFPPGKEDGKPVPLVLNVTVRFRDDRNRIADTGSMPAPIVGDFSLMPADASGRASGPEGFAVEAGDGGIAGELAVDVPKKTRGKTFHVVVNDRLPGGRTAVLLDRSETADPRGGIGVHVFRRIDPSRPEERGLHAVSVTVDGRPAGGARYRVAGAPKTGKK
ncbi:MAG TPA: energy transducer TonB [Thermoanaerobaculia bacterium]|nr:energy transducer TonB [Thermoanaerobaculia bacterium]